MLKILVLGGTIEARELSLALVETGHEVTISFAGLTRNPLTADGVFLISGGFGGPQGLANYLRNTQTDILIDSTHPFANRMSRNAFIAGRLSNTEVLALRRPSWNRRPGDRWKNLDTLEKAVKRLRHAKPKRVLLALGGQGAEQFRKCRQHQFQARVLINSATNLATSSAHRWKGLEIIRVDSRRTVTEEINEICNYRPDLMIVRNAGGPLNAKLDAARRLSLPVWLIDRPPMPPVPLFSSPTALLKHLQNEKLA